MLTYDLMFLLLLSLLCFVIVNLKSLDEGYTNL